MFKIIYRSILMTLILTVILCGAYPLLVTIVGQVLFHDRANGGILVRDGKRVGARLIGQGFSRPEYFHGRPSAAGDKGYDATNSGGSNLGPTSQKLLKAVEANVKTVLQDNPGLASGQVPVELVTASGSGLDPHISPEGAYVQVARVAKARGISPDQVKALVAAHTEGRQYGIFGEPVVNVLLLNLDLDQASPVKK
jgi:K+-transporting ATPase ATPase C chain